MERIEKIKNALKTYRERYGDRRIVEYAFAGAALAGLLGGLFFFAFFSAPRELHTPTIVHIERGQSLTAIAKSLKEEHVIKSPLWFTMLLVTLGGESGAVAGNYFLPHPQNMLQLAFRIVRGDYELEPVKVTFPEGATAQEMALILKQKLGRFDTEHFLSLVQGKEGYLFPDTYYFLPGEIPETVTLALEDNFFKRISSLEKEISAYGKPLSEIVTMASLLEEEARTTESRRIISGILWRRIEEGMRLQVDAVFPYIIGKNTFELTRADLAIDSPYNTYRNEGLPLGPISNPGLDSLRAAVTPISTPYLFYLSDMHGAFHYSRTYEEHLRKKKLYLDS